MQPCVLGDEGSQFIASRWHVESTEGSAMASNYVLALTLVSCVVGALLLKWLLTTFFFNQYDLNKIPSPPASFIYGHLSGLLQPNFHRLLSKWTLDYGLIYRVRIFGLSGIVVADPLEIARILGQERGLRELPKAARTYQVLDRVRRQQRCRVGAQ